MFSLEIQPSQLPNPYKVRPIGRDSVNGKSVFCANHKYAPEDNIETKRTFGIILKIFAKRLKNDTFELATDATSRITSTKYGINMIQHNNSKHRAISASGNTSNTINDKPIVLHTSRIHT